jgi:hypothetical protein
VGMRKAQKNVRLEHEGAWESFGMPGSSTTSSTETIPAYSCVPGCPVVELDRQSGELKGPGGPGKQDGYEGGFGGWAGTQQGPIYPGETGGASRFFYVAKASRAERNAGLDGFEERKQGQRYGSVQDARPHTSEDYEYPRRVMQNAHPTVKPIDLMRWLCRLVTPPEGTILDPFVGSGTTGIAAVLEDFDFVGIEREAEYIDIARARLAWWEQHRGREADEVLAITRRSDAERERHETAGQLGLLDD